MTPMQVWTIIRWPIALVLLAAVANYAYPRFLETLPTVVEFDAEGSVFAAGEEPTASEVPLPAITPTAQPTLAPPTGPVTDGQALPIADFHVNRQAAFIAETELVLTDDPEDSITLAFNLPPGDPACMTSMTLTMNTAELLSATQVSVYASTLSEAATIVNNEQVDQDLRATPAAMATALISEGGPVTFDLLAGYQQYFTLGLPPATPFVLAVLPAAPVESQGGVRFVAADAQTEEVPILSWVGTPGCPGATTQ